MFQESKEFRESKLPKTTKVEELLALTAEGLMGRLWWDRQRDRVSFTYDEAWQFSPIVYPLSLSMPLSASTHEHKVVDAFLWGLLPDNDGVLRRWGELNPYIHIGNNSLEQGMDVQA